MASPVGTLRRRWGKGLRGRYPVHEVVDLASLEERMSTLRPAVVFLDLALPGLGGVGSVAAIQRLTRSAEEWEKVLGELLDRAGEPIKSCARPFVEKAVAAAKEEDRERLKAVTEEATDFRADTTLVSATPARTGFGGGVGPAGSLMTSPVAGAGGGPRIPVVAPSTETRLPGVGAAADLRMGVKINPDRQTVSVTVNPVFASIVGAIAIGEGIGLNLIVGLAAVVAGIWIATT